MRHSVADSTLDTSPLPAPLSPKSGASSPPSRRKSSGDLWTSWQSRRLRPLRYACYFMAVALVAGGVSIAVFVHGCVNHGKCGVLQEPRGFIALGTVAARQKPGHQPRHAKCTCHVECPVTAVLDGPELTPEQIAARPKGEINHPFVSRQDHFPGSRILEEHWQAIQSDAQCLIKQANMVPSFDSIDEAQTRLASKGKAPWRTFVIKAYGKWLPENSAMVPATTRLLKSAGDELISSALFSILEPGKSIPSHCAAIKTVYRYHLGLVVPVDENRPYIQVEDFIYKWKEGEGVMFDDTFRHEVVNNMDPNGIDDINKWRVVLFIDIYRKDLPYLSQFLHKAGERLLDGSPVVEDGHRKATVVGGQVCPDIERVVTA